MGAWGGGSPPPSPPFHGYLWRRVKEKKFDRAASPLTHGFFMFCVIKTNNSNSTNNSSSNSNKKDG